MGRINMMQRRVPASEAIKTPQAQCLGEQTIEWSYVPYQVCESDKAPFLPAVQAYLYPPVSHAVRSAQIAAEFSALPSAFRWDEPNLQFSAFKKCIDRDGYILRFFENQGKRTKARIHVGKFRKSMAFKHE